MSTLGEWLFQQQLDKMQQAFDRHMPRTGIVQSLPTANTVTVTDPLTGANESQPLSLFGGKPAAGDRVLILPLGDGSRVAAYLGMTDLAHIAGTANTGDIPVWDGTKFVAQVSGEVTWNQTKSSTATVASTNATATYQEAIKLTWALPAGTYTVLGMGWLRLKRSPAGTTDVRVTVDGNSALPITSTQDASVYGPGWCFNSPTGIVGGRNVDIILEYKGSSGTGVTTSAESPMLWAAIKRTGA